MKKLITHVGLDVHSKAIVYAVLVGDAREAEVHEVPNDPKVIRRTFRRLALQGVRASLLLRSRTVRVRGVPAAHGHGHRV